MGKKLSAGFCCDTEGCYEYAKWELPDHTLKGDKNRT